jgi:DNA-binding IclR family transcriptional regulator
VSEKDYTVPALHKGLQILEMFDGYTRTLTQAEIAKRFGVSSSSLYRIIQTLTNAGFLNKVSTNTYELGSKVLSSGFSYLASREIVELAAPFITKMRDSTSLSSHLAIREGTENLYVFRALALQRLSVNVPVGTRLACQITAMGRALLSGLTASALESLYQGKRLDDYPDPAPQTLPDLIAQCEMERKQGWHMSASDYSIAIAVPVYGYNGDVIAAINVSGPEAMMSKPHIQDRLISILLATSKEITTEICGTV